MNILKRWAGRISDRRWPPHKTLHQVVQQTFVRLGPKKIEAINAENVTSLAHQMEATLVMGEMLEDANEVVSVTCTYVELLHFVGYMRQLDALYRQQEKELERYRQRDRETGRPPVGER